MKIKDIYVDYINYLQLKNKITTIETINYKFQKYILPYFGDKDPKEISVNDYINFQTYIYSLNYSKTFNDHIRGMCIRFFRYLELNYNIENIPEKVGNVYNNNIFYNSNQKKDIWTKKEFKKFIKVVDDNLYHALFNLLFYTGLRKGEALALKVSDIKNNSIAINKTLTKGNHNGKRLLIPPKSRSSIRTIQIDLFLKHELNNLINYYNNNYKNFNNDFFLFGGPKPIAETTLERKKNYYCDKAGVKQIRIHDFRHSHATMLYKNRFDIKVIQSRLGHSRISTTLDTYVHNETNEKRLINMINLLRL